MTYATWDQSYARIAAEHLFLTCRGCGSTAKWHISNPQALSLGEAGSTGYYGVPSVLHEISALELQNSSNSNVWTSSNANRSSRIQLRAMKYAPRRVKKDPSSLLLDSFSRMKTAERSSVAGG